MSQVHYRKLVQDGDLIICRVNSLLVSECLAFLKDGRKAFILGRKVAEGLVSLVKRLDAISVPDLVAKLDDWQHNETEKELAKRTPRDSVMINIRDKADCVLAFTQQAESVEDVIYNINHVFTSGMICPKCHTPGIEESKVCFNCPEVDEERVKLVPTVGIKLSSIHKAKGLENNRVFFLMPENGKCPHPAARSEWQKTSERCLLYVGVTRARNELIFVK